MKRNDLAFRGAKRSHPELGYKLGSIFRHMKKLAQEEVLFNAHKTDNVHCRK